MLRRQNLGTILLLAFAAEVLAFAVVVDWVGWGPALLLGLGSTVLGLSRLRHMGTAAFGRLRAMAEGQGTAEDAFIDGALGTLGAVLLLLPGFLTDLVGLALLAPSCRDWVKGKMGVSMGPLAGGPRAGRVRGAGGPPTIDLGAEDWSRLDRSRPN